MTFQLLALAVVLCAAIMQLSLEHFGRDRVSRRRLYAVYTLFGLIVAGALANGLATWHTHRTAEADRLRLERAAAEREERAQAERRAITAEVQALVALARERDPGLTEAEALHEVSAEVRRLRQQSAQLQQELRGIEKYSRVAKYNVLGFTGIAGPGLEELSPIAAALDGAYIQERTSGEPRYRARCDGSALARFAAVARDHPDFPFSHWALAQCLRQADDPRWRAHAERAMAILRHTTRLAERSPHHDQARRQLEALLAETAPAREPPSD